MTKDEILNASPSQLNEWVDERIMNHRDPWLPPADWSGDISAATEALEQFETYQITKMHNVGSEKETKFRVIVKANKHGAFAETMPLAACRAILLACLEGET